MNSAWERDIKSGPHINNPWKGDVLVMYGHKNAQWQFADSSLVALYSPKIDKVHLIQSYFSLNYHIKETKLGWNSSVSELSIHGHSLRITFPCCYFLDTTSYFVATLFTCGHIVFIFFPPMSTPGLPTANGRYFVRWGPSNMCRPCPSNILGSPPLRRQWA